jgi:hypothetical protein
LGEGKEKKVWDGWAFRQDEIKSSYQSLRPSSFALAFGRAEAPFGAAFWARVNACPSDGVSARVFLVFVGFLRENSVRGRWGFG